MSACPSRLEISRWEAEPEHARPAGFASHVGSCDRCAAIVSDLADARALLLGADPEAVSLRAARAILERVVQRRTRRRPWLRFLAPALLVPVAAALLLAVRPSLLTPRGSSHGEVKGSFLVETYLRRDGVVRLVNDGQEFLAGDRLRFAYTSARAGYLAVFGVDDQGTIFPYYPEETLAGFHIDAGARILLPDSIELDDHKGWERIYAIWSESPLADDVVRRAVATGLAAVENDIQRVTALDLPVEQVSLLLRRP